MGDDLEGLADASGLHAESSESGPQSQLEQCLGRLDDRKRDCVVAAFIEGHTHEQIAQRLSTPVGTVKSWIRRGLLALKECMA